MVETGKSVTTGTTDQSVDICTRSCSAAIAIPPAKNQIVRVIDDALEREDPPSVNS